MSILMMITGRQRFKNIEKRISDYASFIQEAKPPDSRKPIQAENTHQVLLQ
jgi:hypothetical protein